MLRRSTTLRQHSVVLCLWGDPVRQQIKITLAAFCSVVWGANRQKPVTFAPPPPPSPPSHPCKATADILIDRFAFLRMDLSLDWDIEWLVLSTDQRPVDIFRPALLVARSGFADMVGALWRQNIPRSTMWSRAGGATAASVADADAGADAEQPEVCSEADSVDDDVCDDPDASSEEPRRSGFGCPSPAQGPTAKLVLACSCMLCGRPHASSSPPMHWRMPHPSQSPPPPPSHS